MCTRTPQCDNPPLCVPSAQRDPTSQSDSTSHCDPASQRDSSPQCGPYQCDPSRQVPPPLRRNRVCGLGREDVLPPASRAARGPGCARTVPGPGALAVPDAFSSPLAPPSCRRRYSQSSPGMGDVTRSRWQVWEEQWWASVSRLPPSGGVESGRSGGRGPGAKQSATELEGASLNSFQKL